MTSSSATPPFGEVLAVVQEFGPRRSIPVDQRWRERFPRATDAQRAAWAQRCRAIEAAAFALAEAVHAGQLSEAQARHALGCRYPDLDDATIRRTHGQAMWFAAK